MDVLRAIEKNLSGILLEQLQQRERSISSSNTPKYTYRETNPDVAIQVITEPGKTQIGQQEVDRKSENSFRNRSLCVQWCLFGVTVFAFLAAAYYAWVADRTLTQIKQQTAATIEMAKSASGQLNSTKEAMKDAGQSFLIQERPWVGVTGYHTENNMVNPLNGSVGPGIQVDLLNAGKSPAFNVRPDVQLAIVDKKPVNPPSQHVDWAKEYGSSGSAAILPGKTAKSGFGILEYGMTEKDIPQLGVNKFLCVYGKIEYTDIFAKDTRRTTFCAIWYPGSPPAVPAGFTACKNGNDIK
jgi:hypothetical protein